LDLFSRRGLATLWFVPGLALWLRSGRGLFLRQRLAGLAALAQLLLGRHLAGALGRALGRSRRLGFRLWLLGRGGSFLRSAARMNAMAPAIELLDRPRLLPGLSRSFLRAFLGTLFGTFLCFLGALFGALGP